MKCCNHIFIIFWLWYSRVKCCYIEVNPSEYKCPGFNFCEKDKAKCCTKRECFANLRSVQRPGLLFYWLKPKMGKQELNTCLKFQRIHDLMDPFDVYSQETFRISLHLGRLFYQVSAPVSHFFSDSPMNRPVLPLIWSADEKTKSWPGQIVSIPVKFENCVLDGAAIFQSCSCLKG